MNAGGVDKACKSSGRNYQLSTPNNQHGTINKCRFATDNSRSIKEAIEFHKLVVKTTNGFPREFDYLRQQMRRASLSVVLNIAEGSAKNSDKDFNRFLMISLGSVDETMAGGEVSLEEKLIAKTEFDILENKALSVGKQLGGFSKKLKQR